MRGTTVTPICCANGSTARPESEPGGGRRAAVAGIPRHPCGEFPTRVRCRMVGRVHRMPAVAALVVVTMTSAVGCVALSSHAPPPAGPAASRVTGPRIGQRPARESLTGTGREPAPEANSASPGARTGQPEPSRSPAAGDPAPAEPPAPVGHPAAPVPDRTEPVREPDHQAPPAPGPVHEAPPPQAPAPPPPAQHADPRPAPEPRRPAPAPPARTGVCGLGETYGRWQQGSDASRICRQVYGR